MATTKPATTKPKAEAKPASFVVDGKTVELTLDKISVNEGCDLEDLYGGSYDQWSSAFVHGHLKAIRALMVVLGRRVKPGLEVDDLAEVDLAELLASATAKEKAEAPEDPAPTPFVKGSGRPSVKSSS